MKRLSVIIPGYNTPIGWWRRCVNSVICALANFDSASVEIICVDDGSHVPIYENMLPKANFSLRVIRLSTNGGLPAARNAGLEVACGEYITFVDSDDEVLPEIYDSCVSELERNGCDIAIFGVRTVWPNDGLQKTDTFDESRVVGHPSPDDIRELDRKCLLNYAWNKVYRRRFLAQNKLIFNVDGVPCEDIIFNLQCIMAGTRLFLMQKIGYVYYRTRGTLLSRYKTTSLVGTHIASETWRKYKSVTPGAYECLGTLGETCAERDLLAEWRNIWMLGTPYSLFARWRWLCLHRELGGIKVFVKMLIFMFFRRHFYIRPVRRWNTKRTYSSATEWHETTSTPSPSIST